MSDQYDPTAYDYSKFDIKGYAKRVEKPWGYEIHWAPDNLPYMGKILHIDKGKRLSMQVHSQKQETYLLLSGEAKVVWDNEKGELVETMLRKDQGFTCAVGQRHRLTSITDCDILEASTPEIGVTWRLDDDYARPHETDEQRKIERS